MSTSNLYRVRVMVFSATFSNCAAISWIHGGHFICRGNQTTYCRKSLTNFITESCTECTPPCVKTLTSQVVVNPSHVYSQEVTGKMMQQYGNSSKLSNRQIVEQRQNRYHTHQYLHFNTKKGIQRVLWIQTSPLVK